MNLNLSYCKSQPVIFNIIFLLILLFSCKNSQIDENQIRTIDLKTAFENIENNVYENIVDQINYIKLETHEDCMVGNYVRFYAGDTYILLIGFRQILLFDKETGKFIKEIGGYSRDPLGYRVSSYSLPYIENQQIIFARDWDNTYCGYNILGEKTIILNKPVSAGIIASCWYLNDSIFAGYIQNSSGIEDKKIVLFNKAGQITKIFPNYLSFERKRPNFFFVLEREGLFYNYQDHLFFKEIFNDTIFQVDEDILAPRYVFDMGEFSPPYSRREELSYTKRNSDGSLARDLNGRTSRELDDFFQVKNIIESQRFILFEFSYQKENYWGFYDKRNNATKIFENSAVTTFGDNNPFPFKLIRAYVNNNGELISYIQAFELKEWLRINQSNLTKQFEDFRSINETDNPIVLIVKLKE